MKNIAVFTGTRAEYGLLYWLLKDLEADESLNLQLLVAGMHLSPEFGNTASQIEADGFSIAAKVEMLLSSNTPVGVAKSVGLGILGFADALERLKPDLLIILGDRFEALAIAQTALFLRIPIFHLHGGEITEGAYDDSIRHTLTKLATYHGVSSEIHQKRVIQLGEAPERVWNVGALGLDHLHRSSFLSVDELAQSLQFRLRKPYLLVTYHPVTQGEENGESTFKALLSALAEFSEYQVIITYPNADDGGRALVPLIEKYQQEHTDRIYAIKALGHKRYLSCLKHASGVIGNSSSGIIEAPSFGVPTVNIGRRQQGRLAAASIIHCQAIKDDIVRALGEALSDTFQDKAQSVRNPYGQGNSSREVLKIIHSGISGEPKTFFDISFDMGDT